MAAATHRERSLRVLSLFPHPRFSGHAVLDDEGLVLSGTFTMQTRRFRTLDERILSVETQLAESVRLYRPDVLAVVRAAPCAWVDAMLVRVVRAAKTTRLPLHIVTEHKLEELFRLPDATLYDQLGQSVTSTFFPDLIHGTKCWRRGDHDLRRPMRPMWKAAAGAVTALASRRPSAVSALARSPLPPGLVSFIERASRPPV